jgi:hypothetical protein
VAEERIRIEIGFAGGQTIGAVVAPDAFEALRTGLRDADGVIEFDAEDGTYLLPARSVAYVKRWSRESQIGFGRESA